MTVLENQRCLVVPDHISGKPAIVRRGELVETCPSLESAQRIANAIDELLLDGDLQWALPSLWALEPLEAERVLRYMASLVRRGEHG